MLYFLAGLPRSGSTVLAAILNQNPEVYVSPTSGLIDLMGSACQAWEQSPALAAQGKDENQIYKLLKSIADAKYAEVGKPVVIDKSRGWATPVIMNTMAKTLGEKPKIIATVRNVPDCAASFVRVAKPDNLEEFLRGAQVINHLKESYTTLYAGFKAAPENFLIVDYDDLLNEPNYQLERIHEFLDLKEFSYNLTEIEGSVVSEKDEEVWNIPGLHDVKPVLQRQHQQDAKDVLGDMYDQFDQPKFWLGEEEPRKPQLLDLQLAAGLRGDFEEGWVISQQLAQIKPNDNRAAFNRGWYLMRQGHLLEGAKLMDRGRVEGVFGSGKVNSGQPIWDGVSKGTILMNMEGGLGDQIHGIRFVKDLVERGNKVIVACSGELVPLFQGLDGVSACCQTNVNYGVYHDFWLPSMSAIVPLGYEYKDISGKPYIPKSDVEKPAKKRIGVRWRGNPQFEHEQHRLFPSFYMFQALYGNDYEFISLQKGEGEMERPEWIKEVPLSHWGETRDAISSCDLVITSCTSVAHLSGAMGVETWIVVPVMPYYLWALPQDTTPWYDSVRLFRQKVAGSWKEPFEEVKRALIERK